MINIMGAFPKSGDSPKLNMFGQKTDIFDQKRTQVRANTSIQTSQTELKDSKSIDVHFLVIRPTLLLKQIGNL